jgi:L-ascorbate metabolism protein UlaG (beta-lactamase superfamily)
LIPKSEWEGITHLLITHGDPDHHWQSDRVAEASKAFVICGKELTKIDNGKTLVIAPRGKELTSWISMNNLYPLDVQETVMLNNVSIRGIKTVHGPIEISVLGFKIKKQPGPNERTGLGSIGFEIEVDNKTIINFGDSILIKEWEKSRPDILMLPIGGLGNNKWTMDVNEALEAIEIITPKMVIPCHYNVPLLFKKKYCPADDQYFKNEVENLGIECNIMKYGDELHV